MPAPQYESELVLASPVPTNTVWCALGAIVIEPIEVVAKWSPMAFQVWPPLIVFQTPPSAAPRYTSFGAPGVTASAVTRPDTLWNPLGYTLPFEGSLYVGSPASIGWGPMGVQAPPTTVV